MYKVAIEKFQGPLDLLLRLIETEELDISQVSLAEVTGQYINYLEQIERESPEALADFLVVAAKLLYIKSKTLLPSLEIEEEAIDLEYQLKIYREYLEASKNIQKIIAKKKFAYAREKAVLLEPIFAPPKKLAKKDLAELFRSVLHRLEPIIKLPERSLKKVISIKDKISQIRQIVLSKMSLKFDELLGNGEDKTERIVSFLALLELIKQRDIEVDQGNLFTDITIKKI